MATRFGHTDNAVSPDPPSASDQNSRAKVLAAQTAGGAGAAGVFPWPNADSFKVTAGVGSNVSIAAGFADIYSTTLGLVRAAKTIATTLAVPDGVRWIHATIENSTNKTFETGLPLFVASELTAIDGGVLLAKVTVSGGAVTAVVDLRRMITALNNRGTYVATTPYKAHDMVKSGGSYWIALADSTGVTPVEGATWTLFGGDVPGLLDLKGNLDASANPNYPAASKGDAYVITVAGKVGGASGETVEVGDMLIASADNAGGTEASVGASWFIVEHNLQGAELSANKDASGGYAGLTLFKINFKNALNTFTSFFTNANTAARTYTFQDRDGTIADNTDLALKANLASPTFTGTPAAPTVAVGTNTTQIATTAHVFRDFAGWAAHIAGRNPFNLNNLFISTQNNSLFQADKRFTVTSTGFSSITPSSLFDGDYDQFSNIIPAAGTGIINIDVSTKSEFAGNVLVHGGGTIYLCFYSTYLPASVSGRYRVGGVWTAMTVGTPIGLNAGSTIYPLVIPTSSSVVELEFTIVAAAGGSPDGTTRLAEIDYKRVRPGVDALSGVDKNFAQRFYKTLDGRNSSNVVVWELADTGKATFTGLTLARRTVTTDTTLTATDHTIRVDTTAGNRTITLPTAVGCDGRIYVIKRITGGANTCTVGTTSGQAIDGATTHLLPSQFDFIRVQSNGVSWDII